MVTIFRKKQKQKPKTRLGPSQSNPRFPRFRITLEHFAEATSECSTSYLLLQKNAQERGNLGFDCDAPKRDLGCLFRSLRKKSLDNRTFKGRKKVELS